MYNRCRFESGLEGARSKHRYSPTFLQTVPWDVLVARGSPVDEADIVAEPLVTANLMGMDSQGAMIAEMY